MEDELAPAVRRVLRVGCVWHERVSERIKTIVVASSTVHDVPGGAWVVESVWIRDVVVDRDVTVVDVRVAAEVEIYAVLVAASLSVRRSKVEVV